MVNRLGVGLVVASLCAVAGVAAAKGHGGSSASPIDGRWQANGTVKVAKHIENTSAGDQFTKTWEIKSSCAKHGKHKSCTTTLGYATSGGHQIRVPLHGHK